MVQRSTTLTASETPKRFTNKRPCHVSSGALKHASPARCAESVWENCFGLGLHSCRFFPAPPGLVPLASPARFYLRGPDAVPSEDSSRWPPIGAGFLGEGQQTKTDQHGQ